MKIINKINLILEEYMADFLGYEIFKNPTLKELKSMNQNVLRFCIDFKDKNLYVWDYHVFHTKVFRYLSKEGLIDGSAYSNRNVENDFNYFWGVGELKNNKLITVEADYFMAADINIFNNYFEKNTKREDWLKKWFNRLPSQYLLDRYNRFKK